MTGRLIRSWTDIESWYRQLTEAGMKINGMLRLVEQIGASPYVRGLHAWTEDAFRRLERFIDQLNWIVRERNDATS